MKRQIKVVTIFESNFMHYFKPILVWKILLSDCFVLQHMIRFRYLPFTWGKPKFQVSCAQYIFFYTLGLFPLTSKPIWPFLARPKLCSVFHILFYGRVRRLEKARRPFCNRVPDLKLMISARGQLISWSDHGVSDQLISCLLLKLAKCDKLLPTSVWSVLLFAGKGRREVTKDQVMRSSVITHPTCSPFWTLPTTSSGL